MDLSVVIPTYNGAERLPKVLDYLRAQEVPPHLQWEIIIVDNNSQDQTAAIAEQYQSIWDIDAPLRYVFEPQQGAAFARQIGIRQAHSELVGFLDDDNLPATNWVAEAIAFSQQFPQAGAFSGPIEGKFETEPPEGFEQISSFLAIRNHGSKVIPFEPEKLRLPPAASLVVRRQAWLDNVPSKPIFVGRVKGALMLGGEDYEVLLYLHKAGWQILYNPKLKTAHQIPPQRFERDYLLRLARGCGLSTCQLAMLAASNQRKPLILIRTFLGSLKRLSLHMVTYKNRFRKDLPAACKFEFYCGSLLSPFFVRRWS